MEQTEIQLNELISRGERIHLGFLIEYGFFNWVDNVRELIREKKPLSFRFSYEDWYSDSINIIIQLESTELEKFTSLFKNELKLVSDKAAFTIFDFLTGSEVQRSNNYAEKIKAVKQNFENQLVILREMKEMLSKMNNGLSNEV